MDKSDMVKTIKFCALKGTMKQMRIFANHVSEKGLISSIYKELLQLKNTKKNIPIKNYKKSK